MQRSSSASVRPVLEICELLFEKFTVRLNRELPQPVITIQTQGRSNAAAWFCADRWHREGQALIPEINLCAEHLGDGLLELANSLFHESVHLACWYDAIRDCSASQYHNLHFKRRCESVGLVCERHRQRRYGWGSTRLSEELVAFVASLNIDADVLRIFRVGHKSRERPGSKLKRWSCSCSNVWAATRVSLRCETCHGLLQRPE